MIFSLRHPVGVDGVEYHMVRIRPPTRSELRRIYDPSNVMWGFNLLERVTGIPRSALEGFNGDDLERMATVLANLRR